jgi:hypothetical protein
VCLFVLFLVCSSLPVDFSEFFILFCYVYYCELVNTKLHPDQGQKKHTHTNLKT